MSGSAKTPPGRLLPAMGCLQETADVAMITHAETEPTVYPRIGTGVRLFLPNAPGMEERSVDYSFRNGPPQESAL